jgi:hypothetical protein
MSNPSNLYAEKIFSEHPVALWALDDKSDYLMLLNNTDKDISLWDITDGTISEESSLSTQPFINESLYKVVGVPSTTVSKVATLTSNNIINFLDFDTDLDTFALSCYFYSNSLHLSSVAIGFKYTDVNTSESVEVLKNVPISVSGKWFLLSETFKHIDQNTTMQIVIKIGYSPSLSGSEEYEFLLNGLSLGQWSEEFNNYSMGSEKISIPAGISIESSEGIIAKSYGSDINYGYYLINNNKICAQNFGVPLVYGASNVTKLFPNINEDQTPKPSIIFPGFGFLNESGRYNTYTVEMWLRFGVDTLESKRIFGPVNSNDGLYADDCFLTMVIGDIFKSTYVGEWSRPMLIQIVYSENKVFLFLNGEKVLDIDIDNSTILLLPKLDESDKDQDWLGFYCYTDVYPFELDCFAIYPYVVPEIVAKKRWVYGQAVKSFESIDSAYSGKSAFIDYSFSNYGTNYEYPNIGKWQQGKLDNLSVTSSYLSNPDYSLPNINVTNINDWYDEMYAIQDEDYPFVTFASQDFSFVFEDLNILNDDIKSFHGIFKANSLLNSTLVMIKNKNNSDFFKIYTTDTGDIFYKINVSGTETTLHQSQYVADQYLEIGVDLEKITSKFGKNIATFFGNKNALKLILLNNDNNNSCFNGKMYRFGFSTKNNHKLFAMHFENNGILEDNGNIHDHMLYDLASYTLSPTIKYNKYYLDIGISGYWEDYIPLKYFAKYTVDPFGKKKYSLDYIQYNINFPSPSIFKVVEDADGWKYGELANAFALPIQQTYEVLDNSLFTGYNNYDDLRYNRSDLSYEYDSINSLVKSYVSFQFINTGINKKFESFTTVAPALKSGILNLDNYSDWQNTIFLVENDTIIYPPSSVGFEDLAISVHLSFNVKSTVNRKIKIKNLELSSRSLNQNSSTPINTKSGSKLYPYIKNGIYDDYTGKNPISIYKKSNPYLHLTRYSGIKLKGDFNSYQNRGISMPINENKDAKFSLSTIQIAIKSDTNNFTYTPTQIFQVNTVNSSIIFYIVANGNSGQRAKIYAIDSKTGQLQNGISYYLNGVLVANPVIDNKNWYFLSISFANALTFNSFTGSINLNGPLIYNHISYYKLTGLQQKQSSITRIWDEVKQQYVLGSEDPFEFDWDFWNQGYLWFGVLIKTSSSDFGDTSSNIYRTYMGTNKIIVGNDGERQLLTQSYDNPIYIGSSWQQYILNPT